LCWALVLVPPRAASSLAADGGELQSSAGSSLELDELDEVVGEDAVGAPEAGTGVTA
jgi:hypothetical protein